MITLVLGLVITLLLLRRRGIALRLIGNSRLTVSLTRDTTPGGAQQTADSCSSPGIVVIRGGPYAGPQGGAVDLPRYTYKDWDLVGNWRNQLAGSWPTPPEMSSVFSGACPKTFASCA